MSDSAQRVLTQADYDLERIIDILDEAMMSNDPRVEECLRRLMVTVALTRPEGQFNLRQGPLRQMRQDISDIASRLARLEGEIQRRSHEEVYLGQMKQWQDTENKPYRERYKQWLEQQNPTAPSPKDPLQGYSGFKPTL